MPPRIAMRSSSLSPGIERDVVDRDLVPREWLIGADHESASSCQCECQ